MTTPNRPLRARWLGKRIKAMRIRAGVTPHEAAKAIQRDHTSISRFENGGAPIRSHLLLGLLDRYGVTDLDERSEILGLCDEVANHGWWDAYKPYLSQEVADLLWLEEKAVGIRQVELLSVPALLQTDQYAQALITRDPALSDELETRRLLELRMARKRILDRAEPPRLSVLIHEAALHQQVGGEPLMRDQLEYLITASHRERIELQLLPLHSAGHAGLDIGGGFTVFSMPKPYPNVAYTESIAGQTYIEEDQMPRVAGALDQLLDAALDPEASRVRIKAMVG